MQLNTFPLLIMYNHVQYRYTIHWISTGRPTHGISERNYIIPIAAILSRLSFFCTMLTMFCRLYILCILSCCTSVVSAAARSARVPLLTIFFIHCKSDFSAPDFSVDYNCDILKDQPELFYTTVLL